jgi:very-short-patch-repair endonuclease
VKLLWAIAALVVLAVIAALLKPRRTTDSGLDKPWPLEAKHPLLSEPEQVLYRRLVQTLPNHLIFVQVQLLQALRFKRGEWSSAVANRISQLSLDFLIVRPDTSIVAAIELDDATHARQDRRAADARKTHALKSAGIPLLRWSTTRLPDAKTIESAVANATQRPEVA